MDVAKARRPLANSLDIMIKRLLTSPQRAFRWFFTFMAALLSVVLVVSPITSGLEGTVGEYAVLAIIFGPCIVGLAYLGLIADDLRLSRVVNLMTRLSR